VSFAIS
jgi:Ca2+-transporting ATPase